MTDNEVDDGGTEKAIGIDFSSETIDEAARKIIHIERQCFYGDEPERDRLKKIREELLKLTSNNP